MDAGSKTFDGVWFLSFSHDHPPPHVHGRYAGIEVVVDLLAGGKIRQSSRGGAVKPANPKAGDVRRILSVAAAHSVELRKIWEKTHGAAS